MTRATGPDISRRSLLRAGGLGLGALASAQLLAACGGSAPAKPASSGGSSGGTPKRGGTLRVGAQGGASTDTLDPHVPLTNADNCRVAQLYDQLVSLGDDGRPKLVLATSMEPNKNATTWTIKIRSGVKFHDGRTLQASDVLANFRRIVANKMSGKDALGPVNLTRSKAVNATTLQLEFDKPYSLLMEALSVYFFGVVPANFNPKKPVGTGAFKLKSFTAGQASTFVRFDEYWDAPRPYLDAIITTNIADETAQIAGLQAGQFDVVNYLSAASVQPLKAAGFQTNISKTGAWGPFTMRTDRPPYNDPRVRKALRLLVSRKQMIEAVYLGYGTLGNDVFGLYDPRYLHLPQREQDIEQAKSLLKAAGHEGLTVDLTTTDNGPGQVNAAQVFVAQAQAAGVTIKLRKQDPTSYFANSYLKADFSQDFFPTGPYLTTVAQALTSMAPYNSTHQSVTQYDAWYAQAAQTTNESLKTELAHELMKYDYDNGGNIIPYFFPTIEGYSSKMHGVVQSATGYSPGGFNWDKFWLDA